MSRRKTKKHQSKQRRVVVRAVPRNPIDGDLVVNALVEAAEALAQEHRYSQAEDAIQLDMDAEDINRRVG